MRRNTIPLLAAMATTVTILTTGCGDQMENPYNHTDEEIAAAETALRTWPSLEETETQVTTAVQQIADAATAISPTLSWKPDRPREQGGCPDAYGKTDGLSIETQFLVSGTPIADADWPRVLQSARDIASAIGITEIEVRADQPGNHDVKLYSNDGNKIYLGSLDAAVLRARTGCRLATPPTGPTP